MQPLPRPLPPPHSQPDPSHRRLAALRRLDALAPFAPLALCALLAGALALACAIPGRDERILPEITGRIAGGDATSAPDAGSRGRLSLVVLHSRTPSIQSRRETPLAEGDAFRFEPLRLDVAGREFGHRYRIYLHLAQRGGDRVIWRAQVSRLEDSAPIRLDCDLARPIALGEPCRVVDPLGQPWLLDEGERHFRRLCADCHGRDARGGPVSGAHAETGDGSAPAVAARAPDLTRLAIRHGGRFDRDAVVAWIEGRSLAEGHARGGMPVWGERLSSEFERYADGDELIGATLDPIVAYLESLQREVPGGDPAR